MRKRAIGRNGMVRLASVLLVFAAGFYVSLATASETTLKVHHFLGEESLPHRSLIAPWARQVEKESNGRIKVEIYPSMALGGKAPELVDQVRKGVVDIIWTAAAYTPGAFPRSEVFTLPLVHEGDPVATNLAIMSSVDDELADDYEGVHPLLVHVQAGHALHLGARQVKNLEDLKGMVIRPAGRGTGLWIVEALGAEASKKRHPKLPKALQERQLDGAFMSFQLADTMGVIDAVTSHTLLDENGYFGTSLYLFLMNKARYESLPADLREIIDRNSGAGLARKAGSAWDTAESAAIAVARAKGNHFNTLLTSQPAVQEALQQVLVRWARNMNAQRLDGLRLIKQARRAIARSHGLQD